MTNDTEQNGVRWEIIVVGLLSAALGFYHIGRQSYWNDEFLALSFSLGRFVHEPIHTDVLIAHPPQVTHADGSTTWWQACAAMRFDTHPPLYFMVLRVWCYCFGSGETAVRSLSCLAMACGVMLLAATVDRLDGRLAGFVSGLVMAVSTTQIEYAQEARNYGLLIMLAMAAAFLLATIIKSGITKVRLMLLGLCMLLMQLTHNFAIAAIIAICLVALRRLPRRSAKGIWIAAAAAMVIYAAVWGPMLWSQISVNRTVSGYLYQDVPDHAAQTVIRFFKDPARLLVGLGPTMFNSDQVPLWAVGLSLAVLGWAVLRAAERTSLMFWTLWYGCVVGLLAASDCIRSTQLLEYVRYMILGLPALCGMIGALSVGRWPCRLLAIGCVIAIATQIPNGYTSKPLWREAAATLAKDSRPDEPIVFAVAHAGTPDPWSMYMALSTYLPNDSRHPIALLSHAPDAKLTGTIAAYGSAWFVIDRRTPVPSRWIRGATEQRQVDISGMEVMFHVSLPR